MNSVLKRLKSFKKLTVKETIELIQNEVENQQEHMKLALIGKGQWRICQQFKSNLEISEEEYSKLTSEKRKRYLSFRNTKQIRRYYHLYCTFNGIQMLHKRRSSNLSFMVFFANYRIIKYFQYRLRVTSATQQQLLKMCHLRHRLRISLFRRKFMFRSQDIKVFVFLTIP